MMDGSGGMYFGGGFMWIIWLLVILAIVVVLKSVMGGSEQRGEGQKDSALSILEKRYARGEIDREEYLEKKRALED